MKRLDGRRPAQPVVFATLAMALLFGALATRSDAQVLYGSIVGNVADASKSAVPGAAVTIVHKETNLARETVTRSDGSYTFVNVQPGTYTVRIVLAGFKESVKENVPVSANAITRVPLGNYRNYQSLLNLVPGTTPAGFQNAVTDTPARALTTNVNGTARNSNNTRLDGTTNIYIWLPHHAVYVAPAETVDTVNISTNNFDAEQGMAEPRSAS